MTTMATARTTMFQNAEQDKSRIAIQEEKKDQSVDEEDNNYIRKYC